LGIYDVRVTYWLGEDSADKYQKWLWNEEDHTLHPLAHEKGEDHIVMMEGMTHGNLAAYRQSERMARLSA